MEPTGSPPVARPPGDRQMRLALWLAGLALLGLCAWLGWQVFRGPHRAQEPLTWTTLAPAPEIALRPWNAIVIHHSDSRRDTTASIDRWHRKRGWDGIGYHFVVGNGREMVDGQVDPTFRWRLQREGAHAGSAPLSKPLNEAGVGICLIGNFDLDQPGDWQIERVVDLCSVLIRHLPGLNPARIIGHRDVPGKQTDCPGKNLDIERLRFLVRQRLERPE